MFTFTDDIDRFGLPYKRYDYQINGNEEIVGILFGHFAPFTGPNGHGRMLTALQNIGAKKFLIATPDTRDKIDEDRCMFNTEQRMKIAKMALQVMGLEGTATSIIGGRNPDKIFSKLARVACDNFGPNIRPVFCFGPDREDLANSSLTSFGNKSNSTNFECLVLRDRGEEATSGTAVRNCIKSGDIDGIVRMTGYTTEVAQSLITMWQKNDAVLKAPKEDGMSGKHGLPHLFNDGKSTQMSPSQFLDFIDYLDTTGKGILSKANFQVTEKIDGSSSFLGVDEEGLFFTKFGFSSKARVEDDLPTIYRNLFKFLKECGMQKLLEKWRKQEGVDEIKVQLENVWPEASKTPIDQFVKIVLIPYLPEKIGKGLIIPIQVVSDGKASPNSAKIISEVKSVLAENGITSPDLEYDYEDLDLSEDIAAIKQDIAEIEKRLGNDIRTITANSRTKDSREVKALIAEYQKELQQKIASQFPAGKFGDYYEGLVIKATNGLMFKITSDKFKQYMDIFNKRGAYKESMNTRITERIEGDKILAWSSSKDPNLFEFYYDNVLRFGGTAGSCYGFAVYLVTEPPKSEEAAVGYSSAVRDNLYGTNVFEFEIDQSKVLIFNYDDFLLTKLGQATQASFEDYIKVQCQNIGLTFTEAEYAMIQPDSPDTTNAKCARNFYKLMSRKYYQGRRGNLRTPCDGLEYWGQNDGKTLVIWNNHRLVPRQYSNDNGATWKPIDKTDPRYIDYLRRSNLNDVNAHHQDHINSIFDSHWTEEKEKIYRYLTAFSSNDIEDREGMAAGIFYNIVIHDDRSIDAAFKSNLPMVDSYNHYFRLSKGNPMLDNIYRMGYYFGTLDCGLKIGSEKQSEDTYQLADDIPEHVFPVAVTGGLKLVNAHINRDALSKIPTTIKGNTLAMDLCQIEEDIFDKYEVHISSSKPCYCEVPGLLEDLQAKYDWAVDRVKPGHPLTPEEKLAKKNAEKAAKLKDKIALAKTDKAREKAQQAYNDFLAETGLKESIIESTLDRSTFMSFIERLDEADGMLNDVDLSEPAISLLYELDNHDWMTESERCNYPVDCLEEALLMPNHCWNKSNLKKVCENSLREMQIIYEAKAKEEDTEDSEPILKLEAPFDKFNFINKIELPEEYKNYWVQRHDDATFNILQDIDNQGNATFADIGTVKKFGEAFIKAINEKFKNAAVKAGESEESIGIQLDKKLLDIDIKSWRGKLTFRRSQGGRGQAMRLSDQKLETAKGFSASFRTKIEESSVAMLFNDDNLYRKCASGQNTSEDIKNAIKTEFFFGTTNEYETISLGAVCFESKKSFIVEMVRQIKENLAKFYQEADIPFNISDYVALHSALGKTGAATNNLLFGKFGDKYRDMVQPADIFLVKKGWRDKLWNLYNKPERFSDKDGIFTQRDLRLFASEQGNKRYTLISNRLLVKGILIGISLKEFVEAHLTFSGDLNELKFNFTVNAPELKGSVFRYDGENSEFTTLLPYNKGIEYSSGETVYFNIPIRKPNDLHLSVKPGSEIKIASRTYGKGSLSFDINLPGTNGSSGKGRSALEGLCKDFGIDFNSTRTPLAQVQLIKDIIDADPEHRVLAETLLLAKAFKYQIISYEEENEMIKEHNSEVCYYFKIS